MRWKVGFYEDADGKAPVEEFLDSLAAKQRNKLVALIEKLAEYGVDLPFPYSSQVRGKLRELRTRLGKTRLRILYSPIPRGLLSCCTASSRTPGNWKRHTYKSQKKDWPATIGGLKLKEPGGTAMPSRWTRYYDRLMGDPETKQQIEKELQSLEVGIQIASLRQKRGLNQTQLAARAGMNASKISVIENSPQNMRLGTLLRLAHALNQRLKIEFIAEEPHRTAAASHRRA